MPKLTVGGYSKPIKNYCRSRKVCLHGFLKHPNENLCSNAEKTNAAATRNKDPYSSALIHRCTSCCITFIFNMKANTDNPGLWPLDFGPDFSSFAPLRLCVKSLPCLKFQK